MQKLQLIATNLRHSFCDPLSYLHNLFSCGNSCSGGVATHTAFLQTPMMNCTMTNEFESSEINERHRLLTELELLETLLASETATYPWNPAEEAAEAFFLEQEQQLQQEDWWEEELSARAPGFLSSVEQLWENTKPTTVSASATDEQSLQATLQQRFAAYMPTLWLQAIAHKATEMLATQKSMAQQLVQCVQELLPNCSEDDLLILARPYAYSMRSSIEPSTTAIESTLNRYGQDWELHSDIERAQISLAIARYAISQLQAERGKE